MRELINNNDSSFHKSVTKFSKNFKKLNLLQNTSCLSSYGKTFLCASARGKIKVQPAAVARRKSKNGSRQKQDTSIKKQLNLPIRKQSVKRKHNLSQNVAMNQAPAKKAGRTMVSCTTYPKKKVKSEK